MIIQVLIDAMLAEATINGQVGARIWPNESPDAPTYPYILVSKVSGEDEYDMQGAIGMEYARVQIDVYGLQYAAVESLKQVVKRFVDSRPPPGPPCVIDSAMCITDMDSPNGSPSGASARTGPRIRRRLLEFRIWFRP